MNNLFSVFDPISMFNMPLNWLSSFLGLLFITSSFWILPSMYISFWKNLMMYMHTQMHAIFSKQIFSGITWMFLSVFLFLTFNNFLGIFPYIFTSSSHLIFCLSLGLPLWLGHMLISWLLQTNKMFAHLVPTGTPYPLMPFMVFIELISSVIRPFTLAIRLTANMTAGHILLSLLGEKAPSANLITVSIVISCLILLLILESAVALIQAYVFTTLSSLYVSEVNSKQTMF